MNVLEKWLEFETRPLAVTSPSAYVAVMLMLSLTEYLSYL